VPSTASTPLASRTAAVSVTALFAVNGLLLGGYGGALGYFAVTLVSSLPLLIAGWALVGFGVGMIAPQVYAVAGHIGGGRVLAVVVTFGYAAFVVGPGVIGFLVAHLGLHHAMIVPAVLCAGIVPLAATMPKTDADLKPAASN
jgi:MFS family permease